MKEEPAHTPLIPGLYLAGVTGGIGSGKSTVCSILRTHHPVLSSDRIARELMETSTEMRERIVSVFGSEAYTEDGTLQKDFLADTVFHNPRKLKLLNEIVHPATVEETVRRARQLREEGHRLVFVESALLYEAGVSEIYDAIIAVVASREKILERMQKGAAFTMEDIERRMANQLPPDEKAKRADFVIRNEGSMEDVERNTRMILIIIESMAKQYAAS